MTIQEDDDVLTVVVVFTVQPERQDALIGQLQAVAAEHAKIDGFVSVAIHRSDDGSRVAEYIQWRSREHFDAMMATEAAIAHVTNPDFSADAHVYEVVSVTSAAAVPAAQLTSAGPPGRSGASRTR